MSQNISAYLVQLLLALALAPLLPGIINRIKAKTAGRRGKPLLQTYYDLARLLRKGEVISRTATWTFAGRLSAGHGALRPDSGGLGYGLLLRGHGRQP